METTKKMPKKISWKQKRKAIKVINDLKEYASLEGRLEIEVKKLEFSISEFSDKKVFFSIYCVVGMKEERGLQSIFCRDSVLLQIGKNGGLKDLRKNRKSIKHIYEAQRS